MKHFTIDAENNITVHATASEAQAIVNAGRFSTTAGLAKLADNWPAARLVEIWNSFPGSSPVKKFTDKKTAVTRIWKAIQSLGEIATAPEPVPDEMPAAPDPLAAAEVPVEEHFTEPQPEPAVESSALPAASESGLDQQPELAAASGADESPTTPFDEPVDVVSARSADVATAEPAPTKKTTRAKKTPTGEPKPKVTREGSKTTLIINLMKRPVGATLNEVMEAAGWQAHSVRGFVSGTLIKKMGLVVISAKREDGTRTYTIQA